MELFIRRCNLSLYQRDFEPLKSTVEPARRALVNLLAFEIFHQHAEETRALGVFERARARSLTQVQFDVQAEYRVSSAAVVIKADPASLGPLERLEAVELARRMWVQFLAPPVSFVTKPRFRGCGILLPCEGDVLVSESTIVEMKDGDRPLRAYEFRQLALYAALHFNETSAIPEALEVVNSRRGISVRVTTEEFAHEVAGQSASTFLYEIVRMLSDTTISQ
jgi:hypothetical protein